MGRRKPYALLCLGGIALLVWYAVFSESREGLEVVFLNVGQGDAIFIQAPSGVQALIDGGAGTRVLGELARVMPFYDRSLDMVIATHSDLDHIGGLVEVLDRYAVSAVFDNGVAADTAVWRAWDAAMRQQGVEYHSLRAGERIILEDGIYLDVLGPSVGEQQTVSDTANDVMVVLKLVFDESSLLLTGDMERTDEIRLVQSGADLESDVLKIAHHGSRTSSTDLLLARVQPRLAVISVGDGNRYGHPHRETLERLANRSIPVLRTDVEGRIHLVSYGEAFVRKESVSPWGTRQ